MTTTEAAVPNREEIEIEVANQQTTLSVDADRLAANDRE